MTGDVIGGDITYASNDEGIYASETNGRRNYGFGPPHNSCYMFFGSYTHHAVSRVVQGTRVVILFLYQPRIRFHYLIFMFGKRPEQCPGCFRLFKTRQSLREHVQDICSGQVIFNRFKEDGYMFDPKKEL